MPPTIAELLHRLDARPTNPLHGMVRPSTSAKTSIRVPAAGPSRVRGPSANWIVAFSHDFTQHKRAKHLDERHSLPIVRHGHIVSLNVGTDKAAQDRGYLHIASRNHYT